MIDNFEIDGEIVDANGRPIDMSFFISIIQRLAMRVNLDKPEEFSTDVTSISPKTIFHADLGVDAYTKVREKEIHIYLGLVAIFCKLGSVERMLRNILRSTMTIEDLAKADVEPISSNIKRILDYMNKIHGQKGGVITFQDLEIRVNTYEIMVGYIYGHELSHYLDDVFDFDLRGQHQIEVFKYAMEYLTLFKDTDYEGFAARMLMYLDQDMKTKRFTMTRFWSEEFLADFQGYQFCLSSLQAANSTPRRTDMYIAIAMVFFATRLLELFIERKLKLPVSVQTHPPAFLRDKILGYIVNKKLFSKLEYKEFNQVEWGIFWLTELLFVRATEQIYELRAGQNILFLLKSLNGRRSGDLSSRGAISAFRARPSHHDW